jgi:quercetin dioxygenase-like cupin family protein
MNLAHDQMQNMSLPHEPAIATFGLMSTYFQAHGENSWRTAQPGVETCRLRAHGRDGLTMLIRMAAGARAPRHRHAGGEETYVLTGRIRIGEHELSAGDYLWTPPGLAHDGHALEDTLFLVVLPEGFQLEPDAVG